MKLSKNSVTILELPINNFFFEVCRKPKSNFQSDWILIQGSKMPKLVGKHKINFLGSESSLKTLRKVLPHIGVSYNFLLKSVKSLNRMFWLIEYWYESKKCQICSATIKPFLWDSELNIETFQTCPPIFEWPMVFFPSHSTKTSIESSEWN